MPVTPWKLAAATLALTVLLALGVLGTMTPFWFAPREAQLARLLEFAVLAGVIVLAVVAADEATDRGLPRVPAYALAVLGGAAAGAILGWALRDALVTTPMPGGRHALHSANPWLHRLDLMVIGTLVGGLATFVHVNRRTALAARRRQHEAERARAAAQRRTLESRLQALQARVEPMFLFDTLERIRQLYRRDAAAAGAMLEDLIAYLRAALPHLRESSSTAAREAALARAWLDIAARSAPGWRLQVRLDDAARAARVPAMVVLPLVQEAVAAPAAAGVRALAVSLSLRIVDDRLRIEVATSLDTFAGAPAGRRMLAQIDERLRALHGDGVRFEAASAGAGSVAVVSLPLEYTEPEDVAA